MSQPTIVASNRNNPTDLLVGGDMLFWTENERVFAKERIGSKDPIDLMLTRPTGQFVVANTSNVFWIRYSPDDRPEEIFFAELALPIEAAQKIALEGDHRGIAELMIKGEYL